MYVSPSIVFLLIYSPGAKRNGQSEEVATRRLPAKLLQVCDARQCQNKEQDCQFITYSSPRGSGVYSLVRCEEVVSCTSSDGWEINDQLEKGGEPKDSI